MSCEACGGARFDACGWPCTQCSGRPMLPRDHPLTMPWVQAPTGESPVLEVDRVQLNAGVEEESSVATGEVHEVTFRCTNPDELAFLVEMAKRMQGVAIVSATKASKEGVSWRR